jgi:AraC-like DNA-binding protein
VVQGQFRHISAASMGDPVVLRIPTTVVLVCGNVWKAAMLTSETGPVATQTVIAHTVDRYSGALPGFFLDVVRTGIGTGPNVVRAAAADGVMLASSVTQFPLMGRTTVADEHVVAGLLTATPPGSRWYGSDLRAGTMLIWGPQAEHAGVDLPGLAYKLLAVSIERLRRTADQTGLEVQVPENGEISFVRPTPQSAQLRSILDAVDDPRTPGSAASVHTDKALFALAKSLTKGSRPYPIGSRRRINPRRVTAVCIDYADATGTVPTVPEMCRLAHVSERTLRQAFVHVYGVSPLRYFRLRALTRTRAHLLEPIRTATINEIALNMGFRHQGRFASYYRQVFGELPSETTQRNGHSPTR